MVSVFVDTSFFLTVGILNEKWEWVEYKKISDTKSSAIIHRLIHDLLEKNGLSVKDIGRIIQVAGPGSYTGVRLAEGLSQIFALNGIEVSSFYHFDVPRYLGVRNGLWMVKAHKGELFVHKWDGDKEENELIKEKDIDQYLSNENLYTHYESSFDLLKKKMGITDLSFKETGTMIEKNSSSLFDTIVSQDIRKGPFYFRSIDQEFNRGKDVL